MTWTSRIAPAGGASIVIGYVRKRIFEAWSGPCTFLGMACVGSGCFFPLPLEVEGVNRAPVLVEGSQSTDPVVLDPVFGYATVHATVRDDDGDQVTARWWLVSPSSAEQEQGGEMFAGTAKNTTDLFLDLNYEDMKDKDGFEIDLDVTDGVDGVSLTWGLQIVGGEP